MNTEKFALTSCIDPVTSTEIRMGYNIPKSNIKDDK